VHGKCGLRSIIKKLFFIFLNFKNKNFQIIDFQIIKNILFFFSKKKFKKIHFKKKSLARPQKNGLTRNKPIYHAKTKIKN